MSEETSSQCQIVDQFGPNQATSKVEMLIKLPSKIPWFQNVRWVTNECEYLGMFLFLRIYVKSTRKSKKISFYIFTWNQFWYNLCVDFTDFLEISEISTLCYDRVLPLRHLYYPSNIVMAGLIFSSWNLSCLARRMHSVMTLCPPEELIYQILKSYLKEFIFVLHNVFCKFFFYDIIIICS